MPSRRLTKAAELKPGEPSYQYTLAAAKVGKRQFEAAQRCSSRSSRSGRRDPQLQYALGSVLYVQGRLDEAAARLRESVRLQPEQLASHYYLALVARDQGNDAEAIEILERLLQRYPDHARRAKPGRTADERQRYDEAERNLRKAVRLSPKSVKANYQLGLLLARMGRKEEADTTARAGEVASRGRRRHVAAAASPAGSRAMKGCDCSRWPSVLSAATARATGLAPAQAPKQTASGPGRRGRAMLRPLWSQLEAAVKRDPGNPKLHVALGLAYWDRNDYPRALSAFQRAVKVGPRSAEAHNWLGVALSEKSDLPGAIAALQEGRRARPELRAGLHEPGRPTLAKSGDFAEAVAVFQKALALEPNSLGAHLNLGMALREKGDLEAALRAPAACRRGRSGQRRHPLRARADAAAERRSRRRRRRVREGARDRPRAARRLLRARARR